MMHESKIHFWINEFFGVRVFHDFLNPATKNDPFKVTLYHRAILSLQLY